MIGLDTNVLARYIMQDDVAQSKRASELIENLSELQPGFVCLVAMVELVWVLSSSYGLSRTQVSNALEGLLRTAVITVESSEIAWRALALFRAGSADFADCLIARGGIAAGCMQTMTFDRAAAKHAGMTLIA